MGVRSGKGDEGYTDLAFHARVSKDSAHMQALGDLDELISYLGLVRVKTRTVKDKAIIERIQRNLFTICSEIVVDSEKKRKMGLLLKEDDSEWIKKIIYDMENKIKIKNYFHIPGSTEISTHFDIARAVARRAERSVVSLFQKEKVKNSNILSYLNCVSDILFLMARKKAGRHKYAK